LRLQTVVIGILVLSSWLPAAAAAPAQAELRFLHGAHIEGTAAFETGEGAMDLSRAVAAGASPRLSWAAASGYVVAREREWVAAGPDGAWVDVTEPTNESLTWGARATRYILCAQPCEALLLVREGEGRLGFAGTAAGPLAWGDEGRVHFSGYRAAGFADVFYYEVGEGWLVADAAAGAFAGAAPVVSGRVQLLLWNVTLAFEDGGPPLVTGVTVRTSPGPLGELHRSVRSSFAVLTLEGAALDTPDGSSPGAVVVAEAPRLVLDGKLSAPRAEGTIVVDGRTHALQGESLALEGTLDLAMWTSPTMASLPQAVWANARAVEIDMDGELRSFSVGGRSSGLLEAAWITPAAEATLFAVLLAAAVQGLKLLVAPFYTRLEAKTLLRNPNRKAIFDAIRGSPGSTVADLVRHVGLAEVVVRHHVRTLETHRFIAVRARGRTRAYFAVEDAVDAAAARLHLLLRDDTRRRIATLVACERTPLSQRELADRVSVSQRLVSYHLKHLEAEGLIVGHGSMPRRYGPTESLVRLLPVEEPLAAA
jgi:DNA-binding transcriptional ArsR family regulator